MCPFGFPWPFKPAPSTPADICRAIASFPTLQDLELWLEQKPPVESSIRLLGMLTVPSFFIGGAMLSAYFVDRRIQTGKKPLYPVVMFLILLLTLGVFIGGNAGFFGEFGAPIVQKDYILLAALCMACGLQNATVTSAFGAIIRTSHLTGITTDLGIGVVRVLTHSHEIQPRTNEIRAN